MPKVDLIIHSSLRIPRTEIEVSYVRSSGPGGQNVNKVNSKVQLRWNLQNSPSLSQVLKDRLNFRLQSILTRQGEILVQSDRFRDQERNLADAYSKLKFQISQALAEPKKRKATRPSLGSKIRRRKTKEKRSDIKSLRKKPID